MSSLDNPGMAVVSTATSSTIHNRGRSHSTFTCTYVENLLQSISEGLPTMVANGK